MLTKNDLTRSELKALINAYLLAAIDGENYGVTLTTDKEKINFVMQTFEWEYLHNNNRKQNIVGLFAEWLSGLPSSFNIDFENYRIIEIAKNWGALSANHTEKEADKIISNWFNYIANKTFQLHRVLNNPKIKAIRKTKDVYNILANYGQGWEIETAEDSSQAAKDRIKEYRENAGQYAYKIKKKREKI